MAERTTLRRAIGSPLTLAAIVVLGAVIRGVLYLADRSLTLDEAFIALNVERRSAGRLLGELDWNSAAPPAFLEIEKVLTTSFGNSEHVLRAAPLFASLLGLILFARLAAQVVQPYAASLATLLFTGLALTISYAVLAKPYAFDLLFVVAIYILSLDVLSDPGKRWSLPGLTFFGAIAPAFSYASVFAVAASACVLAITAFREETIALRIRIFLVLGIWSAWFLAWYLWHERTVSHLQRSFTGEYIGSLSSMRDLLGAVRVVFGVSENVGVGSSLATVATLAATGLFLVGVVELARRGWQAPALLLLPAVFAAIASGAHVYPIASRTILFIAPMTAICVAAGFVGAVTRLRRLVWRSAMIFVILVVIASQASAAVRALAPLRGDEGIKPIMKTLATRERKGDSVYLSYASQYPFSYYLKCDCADASIREAALKRLWSVVPTSGGAAQWAPALRSLSPRFVIGAFGAYDLRSYYRDFEGLRTQNRVWVVVSFLHKPQRQALLARLDLFGRRVASFGSGTGIDAVTAYLYVF